MKIRPVESRGIESGLTERQAGRQEEASGGFRTFANEPKNGWSRFMMERDGLNYCGSK